MRPDLVLLHGGGGNAAMMEPLSELLVQHAKVFVPNLVGHGGRAIPASISIDDWAKDLIAQLDEKGLKRVVLMGYSVGGTLALYLARKYPKRVRAVCTLAAKFVFDEKSIEHFVYLCQPEKVAAQGGKLAQELADMHKPQDWKVLYPRMAKFYERFRDQPPLTDADLAAIEVPALVISSMKDPLVAWPETLHGALRLPRGHAVTFPGKAHPMVEVPLPFVARAVAAWLAEVVAEAD